MPAPLTPILLDVVLAMVAVLTGSVTASGFSPAQASVCTTANSRMTIVAHQDDDVLFINPATHRGAITFAAMAATIALITLAYCLTLCAFAQSVSNKVRQHRRLAASLQKAAGIFLIGFGIRLGSN